MRAPRFWSDPRPGLAARLLQPVGLAYSAVAEMRMRVLPCARSLVPVICVGNPTLGGAGKTPVAIAIAQRVTRRGTRPGFLSRGYGAAITDPVVVDPAGSAQAYGDEPLLLAREATTVCCPDRPRGADLLVRNGVGTIIMDDGFQNPSLAKDLSFLVVDARARPGQRPGLSRGAAAHAPAAADRAGQRPDRGRNRRTRRASGARRRNAAGCRSCARA